jgi:hypothetical protein
LRGVCEIETETDRERERQRETERGVQEPKRYDFKFYLDLVRMAQRLGMEVLENTRARAHTHKQTQTRTHTQWSA